MMAAFLRSGSWVAGLLLVQACAGAEAPGQEPEVGAAPTSVPDAAPYTPPEAQPDTTALQAVDAAPAPPAEPDPSPEPGRPPSGEYQAEEVPGSPSFEGTGLVWWGDRLVIADRARKKLFEYVPPSTFRELPGLDLQDPTGVAVDAQGNLLVPDCGPCVGERTRPSRIVRVGRGGKIEVILQMDVPTQDLVAHGSGMMYWGGFDHGQVRAAAPGTPVITLSPAVGHSYGVALSPREDVLYASSKLPGTRRLYRFPLGADGKPGAGEVVIALDGASPEGKSLGRIQGITVDGLGNVYMVGSEAQVAPAVVVVSPAEKKVIAMIHKIPSNRADVAFGDPDRRTLYVTGAGRLFRVRLPVSGTLQ